MDYKYIEQLLQRYWEADTTVAEEQILKAFFSQDNLPEQFAAYKDLFDYQTYQAAETLSEDFDQRVLRRIQTDEEEKPVVVRIRRDNWQSKIRPLWQAAASVAIVVLIAIGAGKSFNKGDQNSAWDYNPASYDDTYTSPQQAYDVVDNALEMFKNTAAADTVGSAAGTNPTQKQP